MPRYSTFRTLAQFAWERAHKATSAKARTWWFDQFDCAIGLAAVYEPLAK